MSNRVPGPQCVATVGRQWIDAGTLARTRSANPGLTSSIAVLRSPSYAAVERLQTLIHDTDGILTRLASDVRFAEQSSQLSLLLRTLEKQIPNFRGRPSLRLTRSSETWLRASDTVSEKGRAEQVRELASGRQLTAYDQGAYLAKTSSRPGSAVLPGWNKMDTIEEQAVPAQSIVLQGTAAPQSPGGAWARGGSPLPGGEVQIFHAAQLAPDGTLLPPAERAILGATRPDGSRIHPNT